MIGTIEKLTPYQEDLMFQSPISGVNDWNTNIGGRYVNNVTFQSPISGVNDWNLVLLL